MNPKNIALLGATGSVGASVLSVISSTPSLNLYSCSGWQNLQALNFIAHKFAPKFISADSSIACQITSAYQVSSGENALIELVQDPNVDLVFCAITGFAALKPVLAAIKCGKTIAIANKEILVAAGEIIMSQAKIHHATIIPVDSEHSAIFQCLLGNHISEVSKLIITGSGGPLRGLAKHQIDNCSVEQALKHPTWSMGKKISIDSASLMNKGLELIEARWLFDISPEKLQLIIHPQAIIHSMVEYIDHSIIAQLGTPSMILPVQFALSYPHRSSALAQKLDFTSIASLSFEPLNEALFPCFSLAKHALFAPTSSQNVLNAANEIAVERFLNHDIKFSSIPIIIEKCLENHHPYTLSCIDDIILLDSSTRAIAKTISCP
ncbi:MAG: 1-deoxy-D-xylulose-5-phosphate reductoisomerase [Lentisphaeria bacterium]